MARIGDCEARSPGERALGRENPAIAQSAGAVLGSSAGYMSERWGWRSAFIIFGSTGGGWTSNRGPTLLRGLIATLKFVRRQPALLHLFAGATLFAMWVWGLLWWTPSFPVRSPDAGGAVVSGARERGRNGAFDAGCRGGFARYRICDDLDLHPHTLCVFRADSGSGAESGSCFHEAGNT